MSSDHKFPRYGFAVGNSYTRADVLRMIGIRPRYNGNTMKRGAHPVNAVSRVRTRKRRLLVAAVWSQARLDNASFRTAPYFALLRRTLQWRSRFVMGVLAVLTILILCRAAFVVFNPSYRARAALLQANLQPVFVAPLIEQVAKLKTIGENVETTTIVDLRDALTNTVRIAEYATSEFEAQYASWSVLRGEIKNDGTTYKELRRQLDETQRMQDAEIIRLREALDKAVKPSVWWDIGAGALTFLLGIVSSIFSSMTWERMPALKEWWHRRAAKRFPDFPPLP